MEQVRDEIPQAVQERRKERVPVSLELARQQGPVKRRRRWVRECFVLSVTPFPLACRSHLTFSRIHRNHRTPSFTEFFFLACCYHLILSWIGSDHCSPSLTELPFYCCGSRLLGCLSTRLFACAGTRRFACIGAWHFLFCVGWLRSPIDGLRLLQCFGYRFDGFCRLRRDCSGRVGCVQYMGRSKI